MNPEEHDFFKEGTDPEASRAVIETNRKHMELRMQALNEQIAEINEYIATHSGTLSEDVFTAPELDMEGENALIEKRDLLQREYDNLSEQYYGSEEVEPLSMN